jgi:TonB-dependent starch-binding outer membrane protein SusC
MVKQISRKLILILTLLIAGYASGFAQRGEVTGVVRDGSDGATIPGVSIVIKGTFQGTTTDIDGNFKVTVDPNTTLVFSFIGYSTQELVVQPNTRVEVVLAVEVTALEEFVVIGYGVQKKEDATGAIAVVDERDFNRGNITTPSELLQGKMPGVQITSAGGAPGSSDRIRIRGGSSLSASNDPLIVIDGVPVDSEGITGMRNPLSTINPNDIESFTVLKDASATAIYGSRASNGVIIITTKKGKEGAPLRLNYTGRYSLSTIAKKMDVLSADEFRNQLTERFEAAGGSRWSFIEKSLGTANTDWQDEIFRNAFGHDHTLSASGSYKWLPYRASLGYSSHDGILDTDNMTRTTLSLGLNPTLLDNHLTINVNARGVLVDNQFADNGAIGAAVMFDPTQNPKDNDSLYQLYGGYFTWVGNDTLPKRVATRNPVALLDLRDDKSTVNRLIGNAQFDYKFHFLPELRANLNLAYDYSKSEGSVFVPDYAAWDYVAGGVDRSYEQEKKNELLDFYLNYVKEVNEIDSRFDVMAGYSWQHFWRKGSAYQTNIANNLAFRNGDSEDSLRVFEDTRYETESFLVSFFGRLNYAFKDRYLFTFTLRNDGSSKFRDDNKWGLFPSYALAWKIKEESFMQNVNFLSDLKLRLGYGVTGQQNITANDYPALPRYTLNQEGAFYIFDSIPFNTLRPEGYDANLKWEETKTYNIGIDYGIADDRYYGTIDLYYRETDDLINTIPVPAGTNLTNFILTNIGSMENKGVEFSIFTRPVITEDLTWQLGFNATYNESKITKLTAVDDPSYLGVLTGGISGGVGNTIQVHSVGYAPNSFFVFQQVYDRDDKPIEGLYVDRNGDGQITDEDRYRYEQPDAQYFFGITSNVTYKNWDFSFAGRANFGNYVYNNVASMNGELSRLYRPEGPYLSNINPEALYTRFNNAQYLSDYYIQNASFFKMDNISLAYNFGEVIKGVRNLSIGAIVQNAFVITKYEGLDPEVSGGIDNNIYPRPRNFVLSLNLDF